MASPRTTGRTRFTLLLHRGPVLLLANIGEVAASKQSARHARRRDSVHGYLHDLVVLLEQPREDGARVETAGIANSTPLARHLGTGSQSTTPPRDRDQGLPHNGGGGAGTHAKQTLPLLPAMMTKLLFSLGESG